MKLSFQNDVIGLSAETPEEVEICALLGAADGYVFQLHASSDRGIAFSLIGPEDAARRAPLNIVQSIAPPFAPISNLAHTPFEFGGERYASIEGFWQGVTVAAGSPEHWALMRGACEAKFSQNDEARTALLATGERWLTHKVRRDSRTIPGAIMADIWMKIRTRLQDGAASRR